MGDEEKQPMGLGDGVEASEKDSRDSLLQVVALKRPWPMVESGVQGPAINLVAQQPEPEPRARRTRQSCPGVEGP